MTLEAVGPKLVLLVNKLLKANIASPSPMYDQVASKSYRLRHSNLRYCVGICCCTVVSVCSVGSNRYHHSHNDQTDKTRLLFEAAFKASSRTTQVIDDGEYAWLYRYLTGWYDSSAGEQQQQS